MTERPGQPVQVERLIYLSVFNPSRRPWIRRVVLEARYEDPLHQERARHLWRWVVPGKRGLFSAEPWTLDVTGVPWGSVIRYDGWMALAGGPNRTIDALYSQKAFLTLDPRWTPASVGVDPGQVDWEEVALVVVDLFQLDAQGIKRNLQTLSFQLVDFRGVETPPPPQYYTYQVRLGEPTVFLYEMTYYDHEGQPTHWGPTQSDARWIVLPSTAP